MKKIVHIISGLNRGGAETTLVNSLKYVDWNKFEYVFLCFGENREFDYTKEVLKYSGCRIEFINVPKMTKTSQHIKDIRMFLESEGDHLIIHCYTLLHSASVVLAAKEKYPIIIHAHSSKDNSDKTSYLRKIYEFISKKIIQNGNVTRVACGKDAGEYLFGDSEFSIIYNGIDLGEMMKICRDYHISDSENTFKKRKQLKIGMFGRLVNTKNHIFAIEVVKEMVEMGCKDINLQIYGEGNMYDELLSYIISNELSPYISLNGITENVPEKMLEMDIMIMPSKFEGFPMVMIESQAIGLKSLVSDKVTAEVDLNLGLVSFLPLDVSKWIEFLIEFDLSNLKERCSERNMEMVKIRNLSAEKYNSEFCEMYERQF